MSIGNAAGYILTAIYIVQVSLLDMVAWEVEGNKLCKILARNLGMEALAGTSPLGAVVCGTLPL